MDSEHTLVITNKSGKYFLETTGKTPRSIFTYVFSKDVNDKNEASEIALLFAQAPKNLKLKFKQHFEWRYFAPLGLHSI